MFRYDEDSDDALFQRIGLLILENPHGWQSLGASFGLIGGMLSIVLGLSSWVLVSFIPFGRFSATLNLVEIFFFTLSLPLLALGTHCLDLLEQRRSAATTTRSE